MIEHPGTVIFDWISFLSLLYGKNDLFPEEDIWLWRNGMPSLSALRTLAVGSLLGPQKEREVEWYLEPGCREKLLSQLRPHLDKIAQIIRHYAISVCVLSPQWYFFLRSFSSVVLLEVHWSITCSFLTKSFEYVFFLFFFCVFYLVSLLFNRR